MIRAVAGDEAWRAIDADLIARRITLREALRRQAALVRLSRADALALLEAHARVDPTFPPFVERVRARGWSIRIVSSGIASVIRAALERAGVEVEVLANEVDFAPTGWTMTFIDDSANGHDKAAHVRAAHAAGAATIYIGDGISDFEAAEAAEMRFAKRGRALEAYCRARGVAAVSFSAFAEVEAALFSAA